jgi:hypothetical protein
MLTIELRMVRLIWARSAISFKHVPFWFLFSDPHLTTYNPKIGVQIIVVFELGMSTFLAEN